MTRLGEWLRFELRIAQHQGRLPRRRRPPLPRRRTAPPRWLMTLDLALGAFYLAGKLSPLVWILLLFALWAAAILVLSVWPWLVAVAAALIIRRLVRRYRSYRASSSEVPF